jgi:hypothetical protein
MLMSYIRHLETELDFFDSHVSMVTVEIFCGLELHGCSRGYHADSSDIGKLPFPFMGPCICPKKNIDQNENENADRQENPTGAYTNFRGFKLLILLRHYVSLI